MEDGGAFKVDEELRLIGHIRFQVSAARTFRLSQRVRPKDISNPPLINMVNNSLSCQAG